MIPVSTDDPGWIDVHHHITAPGVSLAGLPNWTPKLAVAEMDSNGIATGIGYPGPIGMADVERGRSLARRYNEFGTQIGTEFPGRFGLFASLPMLDVEGALAEIAYASDVLRADGFGIATNYGESWLGNPRFRPIFEELNRREAVVFVHPTDAPCCTPETLTYEFPPISGQWIEWPMNTARTILSLMSTGTLRSLSNIRFIFAHGGGVMPLLVGRLDGFVGWPAVGPEKMKELFPTGVAAEFRNVYVECAQAYAPEAFNAVAALLPPTHLLFGTDFDRILMKHSVDAFDALRLPHETLRAVGRDNAALLLSRWR